MTVDIRAPGLKNILQEIRKNPRDTLLADRFLSLCSDLADQDDDKVVALLIYADILSEVDYKQSLNIAYQVYSHNQIYDEIALELIVEIFQKMGKKEASDTVAQELQKLIERKQVQAKTQIVHPAFEKLSEAKDRVEEHLVVRPSKNASEFMQKDPVDLKVRFKMSDVVESEEKLIETMLYDLISKEQFEDAEDLLLKIDRQFPQRFWAQKAREIIQKKFAQAPKLISHISESKHEEKDTGLERVNANNFSSFFADIQNLMGENQYRRAFLKLRRFILEDASSPNLQPEDVKLILKLTKECVREQGLVIPKEVSKENVSIKELKEAFSKRFEQKLQSVLL